MLTVLLSLFMATGCVLETEEEEESSWNEGLTAADDDNVVATDPGSGDQDAEDSGIPDETEPDADADAILAPGRLEGLMTADYTYIGSLGEFSEPCEGDAFITVDEDSLIEGEGTCANEFISFGFLIEGAQDGAALTGVLVGESAAGRAETPFEGTRSEAETVLTFDHTHAADGESLRLVGSINLALTE